MRGTSAFVGWLLLAAAGTAAAQSPTPSQPPERKAPSGPGLNLKLDEADLRSLPRSTSGSPDQPGEQQRAGGLPSLGADVRAPLSERPSPIPQDTNPGRY